ncbi:MAG TPA: D-amino acid dehydrogenase [Rhizomicrobium sp.]|nr:D-amino acid dehydrogenase [Rhizomicrobium sp.]
MKVVVLGGGVIGVTTAYYLTKAGHEVVVIERQPGPALETSFANAGEISPGYSSPWAAPGLPIKAIKWLFMRHRPLVIRPGLDLAMVTWGIQLLANCTTARYELNKGRMLRLAEYSRDCLRALRADTGITYDQRTQGTLQLFRDQKQLDGANADIAVLKRLGVAYEILDMHGCAQAEPALTRVREKFAGGLRLPGDETGDCYMYTTALAAMTEKLGATFLYGRSIRTANTEKGAVTSIELTDGTEVKGNRYVLALGSYSPNLASQLDIRLPIYPVKGYSLTFPITDAICAPESTVMDETYKVAITRLGDRVRVGGTAELNGFNRDLRISRRQTLEHVVNDVFPGAGDSAQASFWTGLRPMTPDGPPFIGPTHLSNFYLNTGHGTLGWTMAAGSGRALSDLISGKRPDIDLSDFGVDR